MDPINADDPVVVAQWHSYHIFSAVDYSISYHARSYTRVIYSREEQSKESLWYPRTSDEFLRLDDLADEVLAVDRVALLDEQAGNLAAVRGGDDHFLDSASVSEQSKTEDRGELPSSSRSRPPADRPS